MLCTRFIVLGLSACQPLEHVDWLDSGGAGTGEYTFHAFECAAPEERDALGPFHRWSSEAWDAQEVDAERGDRASAGGWGSIVGDFNGDGVLDIYLPNGGPDTLWLGDGRGGWHPGPTLPTRTLDTTTAGTAADIDGDGDLDLLLASSLPQYILENQGDATFVVREFLGVSELGFTVAAADVDGDGDLDALQAGFATLPEDADPSAWVPPGMPIRLALNDGSGRFVEATERLPGHCNDGYPFVASFIDMDGDLDPDLFVANDFAQIGTTNQIWRNDGGVFVDVTADSGIDLYITAMGLGVGDLNHDQRPDFALTGTDQLALLESQADGIWAQTDMARGYRPVGERDQRVGWGVEMGDLDNDGRTDMVTGFGYFPPMPQYSGDQYDAVHLQQDDGRFTDVADGWGLDDPGWTRGVLLVDLNDDGWLDLVRRRLHERPRVDLARCGSAASLVVELAGSGANPDGIGARVEVDTPQGTQVRWIQAGGHGLASGGPPRAHFGLGDHQRVDAIRVHWRDGFVSDLRNVPANGRVTVLR